MDLALRKWLDERGPQSGSKAQTRTGVGLTRQEFTAIPLREMGLLWTDRSTGLRKHELQEGQKLGTPRIMEIELEGKQADTDWSLALGFTYRYPELVYVKPTDESLEESVLDAVKSLHIVHVPPFSGIGSEETRYDKAYQNLLIGQGKPGDVLRNLLLEVHRDTPDGWKSLCNDVKAIFGYWLLPPVYGGGQPYIVCEYQPGLPDQDKGLPKPDISCAGSGFLQVLMLLGFIYARPSSLLLLDEPDAHLHVILQKQLYDRLRRITRERQSQLLIATHAEVLVDATPPERIVSLFEHPHNLVGELQRNQVREALKRLTGMDLLLAEQASGIIYLEGETGLDLLREWAQVLEHPTRGFFGNPFWHSNQGRHPREARGHFFALKAVKLDARGVLILDGDNRDLPDHELTSEGWRSYPGSATKLRRVCFI